MREIFTKVACGVFADIVKAFLNKAIGDNFQLLRQRAHLRQMQLHRQPDWSRWKRLTSWRRAAPSPSCSKTAGLSAAIRRRISKWYAP